MMRLVISKFKKLLFFCKEIVAYFFTIDGSVKAAALTYSTLISLVPFMVLSVAFLTIFPDFAIYFKELHSVIFRHLVPTSAHVIQNYVEHFAQNATNLSATSFIFIFFTAILLIFSMETLFNSIWRVKTRRKGLPAFLMYWAILTLLPPIGCFAFALTMFLYSLPYIDNFLKFVSFLLPLFFSWLGFLFLYITLPNCKVYFRHASIGALVAACIFEIMKVIFRMYVEYFSTDTLIYGVLAAIPVFLLWLYLVWVNVIIGAITSYKISLNPSKITDEKNHKNL